MIGLFLAMLELVRDKRVAVKQEDSEFGKDVRLEMRDPAEVGPESEEDADWRDPETGEMQYDWPDEKARRRFERRQRRRKGGFDKSDITASDEDDDLDEDFDEDLDEDADEDFDEDEFGEEEFGVDDDEDDDDEEEDADEDEDDKR